MHLHARRGKLRAGHQHPIHLPLVQKVRQQGIGSLDDFHADFFTQFPGSLQADGKKTGSQQRLNPQPDGRLLKALQPKIFVKILKLSLNSLGPTFHQEASRGRSNSARSTNE